ncbi:DUF2285 domain-containing protein [Paraburkholderia sp. 31.1]|nr:DUF2285 domain-containing protein [Paraburkholderia sp. 31.1]
MKVHIDGIYRKVRKQKRPQWRDESSYPSEPAKWSYRRWAWEFLRRNPEYFEECDKINTEPDWLVSAGAGDSRQANRTRMMDLHRNKEVARRFGRCELKSCWEAYRDEEDSERLWLSETVQKVERWRPSGGEVRMELESGQVAIVFDLNRCIESGRSAMAPLLGHAKEILDRELAAYEKTLPDGQRSKVNRIRRDKLLLWLRLYDAEYSGADRGEMAEVLYADRLKGPAREYQHRITEVRKRISADLKRAREMVESGYLGLVPLDSLQDRSSRLVR